MKSRSIAPRSSVAAFMLCLTLLGTAGAPLARADDASRAAKVAELMRLTGLAQMLAESKLEGKATTDRDDAVRTWGRLYSENLTDADLDAILAFYRSPVGQKDVSARAVASSRFQRYLVAKNTTVMNVGTATVTPPANPDSSSVRPWDSNPTAPNGRVVPNPTPSERCEVAPATSVGAHALAVPPSGRSLVCVCIDEKGTLTRDPVIAESSGDSRVDSGAVKMARSDSGRYQPPILDGQPQRACFRFAIDFKHQQ